MLWVILVAAIAIAGGAWYMQRKRLEAIAAWAAAAGWSLTARLDMVVPWLFQA